MIVLDACVEIASNLCREAGPFGYVVAGLAYLALQIWKHRDKVKRSEVVVQKVAAVEAKVEKVLSMPPPSSSSSPALVPVVVVPPPAPTDLLSVPVDGQSDRETKP